MIPREHLALWLGVSEGRVSQMMHNLVNTWGLVERRGQRGDTRYALSAEGIRYYVTNRDRAQLPTTRSIWSTVLTTDRQGRRRYVGHRIDTWARQTKHADGITWFLSKLEAEARADPDSELLWSVPTARSDRAYNWGDSAITPDAVGEMIADGLQVPFYLEYEIRARHTRGVLARLKPCTSCYWSTQLDKIKNLHAEVQHSDLTGQRHNSVQPESTEGYRKGVRELHGRGTGSYAEGIPTTKAAQPPNRAFQPAHFQYLCRARRGVGRFEALDRPDIDQCHSSGGLRDPFSHHGDPPLS